MLLCGSRPHLFWGGGEGNEKAKTKVFKKLKEETKNLLKGQWKEPKDSLVCKWKEADTGIMIIVRFFGQLFDLGNMILSIIVQPTLFFLS